jgi:(E)-4-hydroxy-3-methylbut-2-enyl-diphosphate synthase
MGCAVNGPSEARRADIGVAGGGANAVLFKEGHFVRAVPEERIVDELLEEIRRLNGQKGA